MSSIKKQKQASNSNATHSNENEEFNDLKEDYLELSKSMIQLRNANELCQAVNYKFKTRHIWGIVDISNIIATQLSTGAILKGYTLVQMYLNQVLFLSFIKYHSQISAWQ